MGNKAKDLYLAKLLEKNAIKQDEFKDIKYKPEINAFDSKYLKQSFVDKINFGWSVWQAKSQATPEGFVLVRKELPEEIAESMAKERVEKPVTETDPTWIKISEDAYKGRIQSKKWELWRDYKAMIEAQEQSHD